MKARKFMNGAERRALARRQVNLARARARKAARRLIEQLRMADLKVKEVP